ncbi:MAG: hypothetical protein J6A67_06495 [Clostridia bacterium]|nr:hypothetical protein [Clostridia bacterium]
MNSVLSFFMSLMIVISSLAEGIPFFMQPTLVIDASECVSEVSSRASGFLYGVAENGVPDSAVVESLDVSSISQKVIDGLQHPIGDVDHVAPMLDNCEYITVYLQDCFDTWYYCHQEILDLRAEGNYDCAEFVRERFLPQVSEKVTKLKDTAYADRLVYCPYNEADNAVWFGTPSEDGSWLMFDDSAKLRFYEAWKETYLLIRSIDSDAVIGGPGYCDYDLYEIRHFLEYCMANDCMPDIMIYHELGEKSALLWQDHVDEYRKLEKELGLGELPIIVTEYGTMYECGAPADMVKYICAIEKSGTWANAAYWRLANNLCDTVADNNSPNSNWWLFRWYADMEGSLLGSQIIDPLHADIANVFKYNYDRLHYKHFNGISSINETKDEITVICSGADYSTFINLKNLDETNLGKKVNVKIESVCFEGLSGIVNSPTVVSETTETVRLGKLRLSLKQKDPTAVYHITISPADEEKDYHNDNLPERYEFEHGTLAGGAYTYDSAYATTGEIQGMVGGLENVGDSVSITFSIKESGYYDLALIYGNSNDGTTPDDRVDTLAIMTLDGEEENLLLPNTIKSEYSDKHTLIRYFEKGRHTLTLAHGNGTFVADSMLLRRHEEVNGITILEDSDRTNETTQSYLAVAPNDGFYRMKTSSPAEFSIDSASAYTDSDSIVYLRKGLNYIDFSVNNPINCEIFVADEENFRTEISADQMMLSGSAELCGDHIENISSLGGSATFTVNAPEDGSYRLTLAYSNNDEGGVHSYNVDLIERFVTVNVNGKEKNLWCRNTYSWDTVRTATMNITLHKGENTITLSNDGSVKFNNNDSYAPYIFSASVNDICND